MINLVDSQHRPQDITDIAENWSRLTLQVPLVEQELPSGAGTAYPSGAPEFTSSF